jgi:hypothetical protein
VIVRGVSPAVEIPQPPLQFARRRLRGRSDTSSTPPNLRGFLEQPMKRLIWPLLVSLLAATTATAGTKVLGVEIGSSTYDQVRSALAEKGRVTDIGSNRWTGGAMLEADAAAFDIDGLRKVIYIFDPQGRLQCVQMQMRKDDFDAVYQALIAKYRVTTDERPFVGNKFARFTTDDAVIELDAPHLSFEMNAAYMKKEFAAAYQRQSSEAAAEKKKRQAAQF